MNVDVPYLFQRGKSYYYRRAIPKKLQSHFGRGREWMVSFGPIAVDRAIDRARMENRKYERAADAVAGIAPRPEWAADDADSESFDYEIVYDDGDLSRGRTREIILARNGFKASSDTERNNRIALVKADPEERALLEGKTLLMRLLASDEEKYPLNRDKHRRAAFESFTHYHGNIAVEDMTRSMIEDWFAALASNGLAHGTIKRRRGALRAAIGRYYDGRGEVMPPLFRRIPIPGESKRKDARDNLTEVQLLTFQAYLRQKEIAGRVQKRTLAMAWLIMNSSLGPAEVSGLEARDVVLDDDIPHVIIRPGIRPLKTSLRTRYFPLVGDALRMAQFLPTDIYTPDVASAVLNKHLKTACKDLEAPDTLQDTQVIYSFRHMFIDRLRDANASPIDARYLAGHAGGKDVHDLDYGSSKISRKRLARLAEIVRGVAV